MSSTTSSPWRHLLRSLLPTPRSLLVSLTLTLTIMLGHILWLSQQAGVLFPRLLGSSNTVWLDLYAVYITSPLSTVLSSRITAIMVIGLLWAIIGGVLYKIIEVAITTVRELRHAEKEVLVAAGRQPVYHAGRRVFVMRLLWRTLLGATMVITAIGLRPLVEALFARDMLLVQLGSLQAAALEAGAIILWWLAVFHLYIVLYRLFKFFYFY